ncbi:F0F1 ATP synthase subunit gamma [Microbacterium sp. zg.B48]|uniref:F0F1 ATP synthase subunit gamma n=1 Tax=unclassified Microbacterium TaxID=2609290 RepID=UPI00214C7F10|nr:MULTISPECIES: F0F1 ATP synthase subunit gamma [unclassified Microbacterium]MCR2764736.1 F0F1 ATP synthase subunit gamma [Microbacterium sp. zg.B48]MCR2810127.1 F0F1 ATP synthase subunit gamma [Microbacterium sp. zg.B185]WIM20036.1 F0F1 ATP synthase subunit gamma [Microbacterium sp. zg-B185]
MGAQLRVYKQKISTAQTTKKITKAMELIAASRIQKAMARVRASAPFARAVTRAVSAVATHSNIDHPLTTARDVKSSAVVIFASDRGLAGAFNSQIMREGLELATLLQSQGKEVTYYLVGRKAVAFFQFRRIKSEAEWTGDTDTPEFRFAEQISGTLLEAFERGSEQGGVDEIHLVYNRFVSMMTQTPETVRLLPLEVVEASESQADVQAFPLYEFEPDAATVLDALLPVYIQSRIFNALLQSSAAKHAATQKAMKSASDNADKLITDYTRLRNNARQAEITQQIAEIVGGADALSSAK